MSVLILSSFFIQISLKIKKKIKSDGFENENREKSMIVLPCNKITEYIYIYIYIYHVVSLARISLTFSRLFSLSFIASGSSSGLHPVSSHSCCMYVRAGRPAFARPYVGVHRSTSLMSSSLQCPACLVRLTWIVSVMGGRWPFGALCVVARTCSILLTTFLCNCRLASSPAVLSASK